MRLWGTWLWGVVWVWAWDNRNEKELRDLQGIDEALVLEGPGTINNRHVTNAEKLPDGLSKRVGIDTDLVLYDIEQMETS
jgi:hypothetical protein